MRRVKCGAPSHRLRHNTARSSQLRDSHGTQHVQKYRSRKAVAIAGNPSKNTTSASSPALRTSSSKKFSSFSSFSKSFISNSSSITTGFKPIQIPTPPEVLTPAVPKKGIPLSQLPTRASWKVLRQRWPSFCESEAMSGVSGTHARLLWEENPKTVLLVKKSNDERATQSAMAIAKWMEQEHPTIKLLIEPSASTDLPHLEPYISTEGERTRYLGEVVDFIIAMGGDGTILHCSSLFDKEVPPILSFSMGTLGFLMPWRVDDFREAINTVVQGGFFFTPRERLTCKLEKKFQEPHAPHIFQVMNEVALHRGAAVQIAHIDLYINDAFLSYAKGDGLIIATTTGSTAYSLSCGGSMVHPAIEAILLTPICPRSLSFRPALLPKDTIIKLKVSETSRTGAVVSFDGLHSTALTRGEFITAFTSPYFLPTVNRKDETSDWLRDINDLLSWNRKFG